MISSSLDPALVTIVFLGVAAVAGAVLFAQILLGASGALPVDEFVQQVTKLLRADNAERALTLCDAAGKRPVARLVRVGLLACEEPGVPFGGRVERAKMAMTQRLPAMQAAAGREVVVAVMLGALVTVAGGVAVLLTFDSRPWAAPVVAMAVVDGLALVRVSGRMRLRRDLARAVAEFGK
ncbi:MAG TPA: hypothetical protein VGL81_22380 [Polyangiaceae bacterium]|jgi:hypothetical protein